ncbi:MAG: hypothetical protein IJ424_04025 [Oscillospiraceae bacterium]|nr:hypothetical protein [Oscillospiraceae bacterium]
MKYRSIRDTIILTVIVLSIVALIAAQIYVGMNRSNETEDAVLYTSKDGISFTGVLVRDERPVYSTYTGAGVMDYTVPEGARLSKKSVIANIYDSYDQLYNRYKIDKINNEIAMLNEAQDHGTTDYAQPEFITAQITESYKEILTSLASKDFSDAYSNSQKMLKLMNIYNISTNVESDYYERIGELTSELNILNASLKAPLSTISSNETGYFTSHFDGYEALLSTANISSLTTENIMEIIKNPVNISENHENVIGKVFGDYSWKMVGIIYTPDKYFVNQTITLAFTSTNSRHNVTVDSITPTGNGNEAIIVLSCDELNSDIAATRVAEVELIFSEHTGIKVSRSAIRFVNGVKGVYVIEGEQIHFKMLDVIYEGDDYVISTNTSDAEYLNLYDKVLLEPLETVENKEKTETES